MIPGVNRSRAPTWEEILLVRMLLILVCHFYETKGSPIQPHSLFLLGLSARQCHHRYQRNAPLQSHMPQSFTQHRRPTSNLLIVWAAKLSITFGIIGETTNVDSEMGMLTSIASISHS